VFTLVYKHIVEERLPFPAVGDRSQSSDAAGPIIMEWFERMEGLRQPLQRTRAVEMAQQRRQQCAIQVVIRETVAQRTEGNASNATLNWSSEL
jgi:hypothetical protein